MRHNGTIPIALLAAFASVFSQPANLSTDDYLILKKDESRLVGDVRLVSHPARGLSVLYNGSQEYGLADVLTFTTKGDYFTNLTLTKKDGTRVSFIDVLLKRNIEGKINVFSVYDLRSRLDSSRIFLIILRKAMGRLKPWTIQI